MALDGCFGTGAGTLVMDQGRFNIDTGNMVPLNDYWIQVKVVKGTREGWSKKQKIQVVLGDPPELDLT